MVILGIGAAFCIGLNMAWVYAVRRDYRYLKGLSDIQDFIDKNEACTINQALSYFRDYARKKKYSDKIEGCAFINGNVVSGKTIALRGLNETK